jgi:hypothetical protein
MLLPKVRRGLYAKAMAVKVLHSEEDEIELGGEGTDTVLAASILKPVSSPSINCFTSASPGLTSRGFCYTPLNLSEEQQLALLRQW